MRVINKIKSKARALKNKLLILHLATKHPTTPWYAKLLILLVLGYALSPIDLIPDFIPVVGLLDDLLLLPFGIWLALKMIPESVIEECTETAKSYNWKKKKNLLFAIIIIGFWALLAIILFYRYFRN